MTEFVRGDVARVADIPERHIALSGPLPDSHAMMLVGNHPLDVKCRTHRPMPPGLVQQPKRSLHLFSIPVLHQSRRVVCVATEIPGSKSTRMRTVGSTSGWIRAGPSCAGEFSGTSFQGITIRVKAADRARHRWCDDEQGRECLGGDRGPPRLESSGQPLQQGREFRGVYRLHDVRVEAGLFRAGSILRLAIPREGHEPDARTESLT